MTEPYDCGPAFPPHICLKCTGANGVHYLTCPTLRLPAGLVLRQAADEDLAVAQ